MRKRIFIGALGIVAAYAMVTTTALAVFSPQAQVESLAFRTSSYSLKVSADPGENPADSSFSQSISLQGANDMYPGMPPASEKFWVKNDSTTPQVLGLKGAFSSGDKDWEKLKYAVHINLRDLRDFSESGYVTAGETQSNAWPFPISYLYPGERRQFEIEYLMPTYYPIDPDGDGPLQVDDLIGNEAMGLETTGAAFVIVAEPREEF